ncbi:MAG: hypothetical protein K6E35_00880 [Bacteroidales bacterium]|nr:hypothetical protein [Bacteroidales bacterium]
MIRRFQVAGLIFSLSMPETNPAWSLLHNYDPFEVSLPDSSLHQGCAGETFLFELELSSGQPPELGEVMFQSGKESGEPVVGFFRCGDGYLAEFSPWPEAPICGRLEMSGDFTRGRLYTGGSAAGQTFAINNSLILLFAFASARFRALEMHASVVMHGGRGFLFLGRSGTGKSTHSRLWLKHIPDTELLNDDNPVIRIVDGVARVFGTPWSGKTPCYKAQDVPVGAIVRLSQAPQNSIERLSTVPAYASIMASCSGYRPIRSLADAQHETLSILAQQVPCFHLNCLPDEAAARLCQSTVDG